MKLHLPKLLFAAVVSVLSVSVVNATEYTVTKNASNSDFHQCSFSPAPTDYTGSDAWKTFSTLNDNWGNHTLKFTSESGGDGTTKLSVSFDSLAISGIYVAEGSTIAGLVGNNNTRVFKIGHVDKTGQSSTFNNDFELAPKGGVEVAGEQTWTIAENKTVTLTAGTVSVGGVFTLAGTGTLDMSAATTINMAGQIGNAKTAVTLGTATINLNSDTLIFGRYGNDVSVADGGVEGNGYVSSVGTVSLFSNAQKVTSSGTITWKMNNTALSVDENYIADCSGLNTEDIYLLNSSETYGESMSQANKLMVSESATLTLNETLTGKNIVLEGASSTVNLGKSGVLNKSSVTTVAAKGQLTGTGTYVLGNVNTDDNLYGDFKIDEFQGIVAATGGRTDNKTNLTIFNGLHKSGKLELSAFTGYLSAASEANATLQTNLVLKKTDGSDYALQLKNGSSTSDEMAAFSGSIEGNGDMAYTWGTTSTNKTTYNFKGDTSQWKGKFVHDTANGKSTDVKFSAGGDVFHTDGTGGVLNKNAVTKMNVIIEAASATTFNGSIENVNAVTVNSDTTFKQQVGAQSLTLAAGKNMGVDAAISTKSLTLGENAGLVFGGGKLSVVNALALDSTIITLAQGMEFATAEDYELLTVTGEGNTLSVNGWENWVGNTYNIGGVDYTTGLNLANNTLSVRFTAMPIPEPATATLSLLALAAMAARRRRK